MTKNSSITLSYAIYDSLQQLQAVNSQNQWRKRIAKLLHSDASKRIKIQLLKAFKHDLLRIQSQQKAIEKTKIVKFIMKDKGISDNLFSMKVPSSQQNLKNFEYANRRQDRQYQNIVLLSQKDLKQIYLKEQYPIVKGIRKAVQKTNQLSKIFSEQKKLYLDVSNNENVKSVKQCAIQKSTLLKSVGFKGKTLQMFKGRKMNQQDKKTIKVTILNKFCKQVKGIINLMKQFKQSTNCILLKLQGCYEKQVQINAFAKQFTLKLLCEKINLKISHKLFPQGQTSLLSINLIKLSMMPKFIQSEKLKQIKNYKQSNECNFQSPKNSYLGTKQQKIRDQTTSQKSRFFNQEDQFQDMKQNYQTKNNFTQGSARKQQNFSIIDNLDSSVYLYNLSCASSIFSQDPHTQIANSHKFTNKQKSSNRAKTFKASNSISKRLNYENSVQGQGFSKMVQSVLLQNSRIQYSEHDDISLNCYFNKQSQIFGNLNEIKSNNIQNQVLSTQKFNNSNQNIFLNLSKVQEKQIENKSQMLCNKLNLQQTDNFKLSNCQQRQILRNSESSHYKVFSKSSENKQNDGNFVNLKKQNQNPFIRSNKIQTQSINPFLKTSRTKLTQLSNKQVISKSIDNYSLINPFLKSSKVHIPQVSDLQIIDHPVQQSGINKVKKCLLESKKRLKDDSINEKILQNKKVKIQNLFIGESIKSNGMTVQDSQPDSTFQIKSGLDKVKMRLLKSKLKQKIIVE